jgi:hypothetical protein
MATIDRSMVMGTFYNRSQAERAVAELHKLGFQDDEIGLAGKEEVIETMSMGAEHAAVSEQQGSHDDLVSVTIKAQERWREALNILQTQGAFDTFPSLADEQGLVLDPAATPGGEAHLEYDPIAGPGVTLEDSAALATGEYGLQRDPALDNDAANNISPYVNTPNSDDDSFFGRTPGSAAP